VPSEEHPDRHGGQRDAIGKCGRGFMCVTLLCRRKSQKYDEACVGVDLGMGDMGSPPKNKLRDLFSIAHLFSIAGVGGPPTL